MAAKKCHPKHPPRIQNLPRQLKRRATPVVVVVAAGRVLPAELSQCLLLLVLFAPTIASYEPMRSWVIKKVFPGIRGTITCSDASFGWFSPVVLDDVAIHEPAEADGGDQLRPAITIKKIVGNRPLWKVLWNTSSPGDFTVDQPVLDVVCDRNGFESQKGFQTARRTNTRTTRKA